MADKKSSPRKQTAAPAARSPEKNKTLTPDEMLNVLNKLQAHQTELDLQNEELRHSQKELNAARDRYFHLYDLAPVGDVILNEKGLILEANLTAANLFGVPRDELLNQPMTRFIHKEDRDIYHLNHAQFLETGAPQMCELRIAKKEGTSVWIRIKVTALKDLTGIPLYRIMMNDITNHKRIEEVQAFLAKTNVGTADMPFFDALAQYLGRNLGANFISIDRLEGDGLTARTLSVWSDGHFEDNVTYALKDTPYGDVVGKDIRCFPAGVRKLFPRDQVLKDLRAESYLGVTLWDYTGKPIGLIAVIGRTPLANRPLAEETLKLVAIRAAGELARLQAEEDVARIAKFPEENPNPVMRVHRDGTLSYANAAARELLTYYERSADGSAPEFLRTMAEKALTDKTAYTVEHELAGQVHEYHVIPIQKEGYVNVYARDITARKRSARFQALSNEILGILNGTQSFKDMVGAVLGAIQRETGFSAVGIRLREGDDFPYFAQHGFSDDFLLTENTLLVRDTDGDVCRDESGKVNFESSCTCGLVISGKTDPANPLFTKAGSFWTNDSLPLLDLPPEQDPRLHPRNNCIHAGFNSFALIPIKANDNIVGLLHLNDKKKGAFTLDVIHLFEGICSSIGSALTRKQAEEALKSSLERVALAERAAKIGFWDWDMPTGRLTWSKELYTLFGLVSSVEPTFEIFLDTMHPDDRETAMARIDRSVKERTELVNEYRVIFPDGQVRWIGAWGNTFYDEAGTPLRMCGICSDITERKQAEELLRRMNRELRAISFINQLLSQADDEQTLLNDVCRIICDTAGYRMAWVGYAVHDEAKSIQYVAEGGVVDGYLERAQLTWADTERGRGPSGTVLRTGQTTCMQDFATDPLGAPWRDNALQRGYRSSIVLPLKDNKSKTFGILNIYSSTPNTFDEDEKRLLKEISDNLAFGIVTLRDRRERERSEKALRESELKFKLICETSPIGKFIFLNDKIEYVSPSFSKIFGYRAEELTDMHLDKLIVSPDLYRYMNKYLRSKEGKASSAEFKVAGKSKEGRDLILIAYIADIDYRGGRAIMGSLIDITEKTELERQLQEKTSVLEEVTEELDTSFDLMLGPSAPMHEVARKMRQVAKSPATVLLQGETGVGKSFAAKIIHDMSPRAKKPFIKLDLSSLPESLVESELFGHEKGAFTGAEKERKGYFRLADGGTLFIDELENISPLIQSKLLNVVEEKCFMPIGSSVMVKVDVRIIAATNKDPFRLVQEGKLRQDIFYRLNEFSIHIPPLRERKEDILSLASKFLDFYSEELGLDKMLFSPAAIKLLKSYAWTGNVRELRNVVRRATILASGSTVLDEAKIAEAMGDAPAIDYSMVYAAGKPPEKTPKHKELVFSAATLNLNEIEKEVFAKALAAAEGKKMKAASLLGLNYQTFISKAKKHGIV